MMAAPDLGPESDLLARIKAHPLARAAVRFLRWAIPIALLAIIGKRLTELGWHEVWGARPGNPGTGCHTESGSCGCGWPRQARLEMSHQPESVHL